MINFTTINLSEQPDVILNLKKGYDKILKIIPTVSEDRLRTSWKCIKITLIL